jgi:hypothetical protein
MRQGANSSRLRAVWGIRRSPVYQAFFLPEEGFFDYHFFIARMAHLIIHGDQYL